MKLRPNPFLRFACLSASSISLTLSASAVTYQWDGGAGTGNWQTANNWNPNALNTSFNGTYGDRLNVNGSQLLEYTDNEGVTNYGASGVRGLVVGSVTSGTMTISGGTFSSLNASGANSQDIIGNSNGSVGILNISGGTFIGASTGTNLGLGTGAGRVSTLNLSSGLATLTNLNLNSSDADVNLSGTGILEVNNIAMIAGSTGNISFDGGTLRARTNTTGFLTGLTGAAINGGGITVDSNGNNITIGQALLAGTGSGGLRKTGDGILTLSGTNTYTGATTLSAGTVSVAASANLGDAASDLVFDGGTLQITGGDLTSFTGIGHGVSFTSGKDVGIDINASSTTFTADQAFNQGVGGLTKLGAGKLILNQDNTYSGDTTVGGGALIKESADSTTGDISVASGASLVLRGGVTDGAGQTLTISGGGVNTGGYFFSGSAILRGALQAQSGSNTWAGDVVLSGTGTRIGVQDGGSLTLTGTITGDSVLFRAGATGSDIILNGTGSWTGLTTLFSSGGSIRIDGDNKLSTAAICYFSSGGSTVLDLNGNNQEFAGFSSDGSLTNATITNTAADTTSTLTSNIAAAASLTYKGGIADGASGTGKIALTKIGEGTQVLTAANTYTGATTISEGTLALGSGGSIANSTTIHVASGATLDVSAVSGFSIAALQTLSGSGTVKGDTTINGTLGIGSSPGTMTFDGNLALNGVSNFEFGSALFTLGTYDLAQSGTGDVTFGGVLNLFFDSGETYATNSSVQIFDFGGVYSGDFSSVTFSGLGVGQSAIFNASTGVITVVPEPRLALIGGLGLLVLFTRRRR